MTLFLTSSPTGPLDGSRRVEGLDGANGFVEQLRRRWPAKARCLIVAASPDEHAGNDQMAGFFSHALERSGLSHACFHVWDGRHSGLSLDGYDVVWLGGGHVPTQNAFFRDIGLAGLLSGWDGLVIGISAGSMNAAEWVYAQPELPGEATDPGYVRWMPGLALTSLNLLPHYQMVRDNYLDGMRLFEDITFPDSRGNAFLAIPDGSYVLAGDGHAQVWGEAWRIADGARELFCPPGASHPLWTD